MSRKRYFVTTAFIPSIDKGYWTNSLLKARIAQLFRIVWFGHGWLHDIDKIIK